MLEVVKIVEKEKVHYKAQYGEGLTKTETRGKWMFNRSTHYGES